MFTRKMEQLRALDYEGFDVKQLEDLRRTFDGKINLLKEARMKLMLSDELAVIEGFTECRVEYMWGPGHYDYDANGNGDADHEAVYVHFTVLGREYNVRMGSVRRYGGFGMSGDMGTLEGISTLGIMGWTLNDSVHLAKKIVEICLPEFGYELIDHLLEIVPPRLSSVPARDPSLDIFAACAPLVKQAGFDAFDLNYKMDHLAESSVLTLYKDDRHSGEIRLSWNKLYNAFPDFTYDHDYRIEDGMALTIALKAMPVYGDRLVQARLRVLRAISEA